MTAPPNTSGTTGVWTDEGHGRNELDEVRRAQQGEHDAFDRLAEQHAAELYRVAVVIVGPDDAADATQDALLSAWRELPRLRDPDRFGAWLRRILVNGCRDRLRTARRSVREIRVVPIDDQLAIAAPDQHGRVETGAALGPAVARLVADHRAVVALHYAADLSIREVAEALDIPVGTAKSRLAAALTALRAEIGEEER
ncbi:MAG TPA: RNA polymerase sigma factor [Candidatus Limnocylindrales bacterium]|nr:RNA polymerase sigma factor [Candidatus Limnocylindrales bacterium]